MTRPGLIFGASGFLGRHVLEQALEGVVPVVAAGRTRVSDVEFLECDGADPRAVRNLLDELQPRWVINCAAMSRADQCHSDYERAFHLNDRFPEGIAQWSNKTGARFLHVSTDLVFAGEAPEAGYDTCHETVPRNRYGESKALGESSVRGADPEALIIRLPLLFGNSHGRGLGASDALLAALERGATPALFQDEWRTPLAVEDAAAALLALIDSDTRGVLHVTSDERLTRYELGAIVLRHHELSLDRVRESTRVEAGFEASRARDVSLAMSREVRALGFRLRGPSAYFCRAS